MDISTITTALTGIRTATEIAKLIKNSASSLDKAELNYKLADLISSLADTKVQIAEIKYLLIEKDEMISTLKKNLEIRGDIYYEAPYYWNKSAQGKDGPFCQNCYDSSSKLIRLQSSPNRGCWKCLNCEKLVFDTNYS